MVELQKYVIAARERGLSDETIRQSLIDQGWSTSQVDVALGGLDVPKPNATASPPLSEQKPSYSPGRPSLSHLQAALLHVLLWFFTASSAVAIFGVVASLFGESISTEALASMIAVTIITLIPYAVFFLLYLKRLRNTADLIPGKVWSIITICNYSLATMSAAISLVVSIIIASSPTFSVAAGLVLILNLIVLVTYGMAAFKAPSKLRTIFLRLHLVLLIILLGGLFIGSLLRLGPARADEQLRKDLVETVSSVRSYAQRHKSLPESGAGIIKNDKIEYKKTDSYRYELCASFNLGTADSYDYDRGTTFPSETSDSYVYESQFKGDSGRQCFSFFSSSLNNKIPQTIYPPSADIQYDSL